MAVTSSSACANIRTPRRPRRRSVRPGIRIAAQLRRAALAQAWPKRLEHEEPCVSGKTSWRGFQDASSLRHPPPGSARSNSGARSACITSDRESRCGTCSSQRHPQRRNSWIHAEMALRWTTAGLLEAQKPFRMDSRPIRQPPILRKSRSSRRQALRKAQVRLVPLKPS